MYIIGLIAIYAFLLGLLSFSVLFILSKWYWALLFEILPSICLILQTREVVKYKIKLTDTNIHLAAQREWFVTRHKNLTISYKNLKSIKYFFGLLQARFVSAIILIYNEEKLNYLDVSRFSEKQVDIVLRCFLMKFKRGLGNENIRKIQIQSIISDKPKKRQKSRITIT